MTEIVLAPADVARIRFAHSPIRELLASLQVLRDPHRRYMYGGWLSAVRGRMRGAQLARLWALAPSSRQPIPGFLFPPLTEPWAALADELETVAASPSAAVRAGLETAYPGGPPAVLRPLHDDPARHLPGLVQELDRYWRAALHPVWQRVRALSMADVAYRTERFAAGGLVRVMEDLHPEVSLDRDRLRIVTPRPTHPSFGLAGDGIVLVPCVFSWPALVVGCGVTGQATLTYPTRGVAELWRDAPAGPTDPLSALVGRTRAALLATLGLPRSTTQLAGQLEVSPAAVSQHLKVLKDTALVTARRRGRMVLYQRTAAATSLLAAGRSEEAIGWDAVSPGGG